MEIDATMSVNAIRYLAPEVELVLRQFGLDRCCDGHMALGTAVRHHEFEIDAVLAELNAVLGSTTLDVRALPCEERRARVFAAAEALAPGGSFLLMNDHDPRPLYLRLCASSPIGWTWKYLQLGPEVYVVQVGRPAGA